MSIGNFLEVLSRAILVGIILVGRLGASVGLLTALPGTVGLLTAAPEHRGTVGLLRAIIVK